MECCLNLKNVVLAGVYCENDSGTIGNTLPINHFHMVFRRLAVARAIPDKEGDTRHESAQRDRFKDLLILFRERWPTMYVS